jgi:phospholipid-binding lipoprotein MlaA
LRKIFSSLILLVMVSACATTQAGPNGLADRDPHEELNRDMWEVSQAIDTVVIEPVSEVYRSVTPRPVRSGISNLLRNLTEPWSFINNLLQGKPDRAIRNLGRFIVNSTIGIGGLMDHATDIGIEPAPEDFGQTLAVWGVGDGGFIMNPLIGPTTSRDMVGTIVGFFANPTNLFLSRELGFTTLESWSVRGAYIIDARANLIDSGGDVFLETSADPYAAVRSAYFQQREAQILDYDTTSLNLEADESLGSEDAAFEAALDELDPGEPVLGNEEESGEPLTPIDSEAPESPEETE